MPLPDLIEIIPLRAPPRSEITVPGSKSLTNRALILAALSEGETVLRGALWSEDTQVMTDSLQQLGFMVRVDPDPNEPGNRHLTVYGKGGLVPPGGTEQQPVDLFVGNAGTAARFLAAFVCLGRGAYRFHGVPRMHERPQAALFQALRQLGYRVDAPNNRLPAIIIGQGPRAGACQVSIEQSSQFASALLLCAAPGGWQVEVAGENSEESPYVAMTTKLIAAFPRSGGNFQIEPDASSGSYFLAAGSRTPAGPAETASRASTPDASMYEARPSVEFAVSVRHWPTSGSQIDGRFPQYIARLEGQPAKPEPITISRRTDLGDSIMTAIVLAPLAPCRVRFTDLGRLRLQECERVAALNAELTKCGAKMVEQGDTLETFPSQLHGAEIATYHDHRMAMCFAILGLKVPGMRIQNPACVKKTFPNFFQKLAAAPPHGLGATVREAHTGRALNLDELFAS